jgi:hypothetical protein
MIFGHREGLARAGHAQQHLVLLARRQTRHQFGNRPRLISPRLVARYQFKVHAKIIREERISGEDEGEDSGRLPVQYIAL